MFQVFFRNSRTIILYKNFVMLVAELDNFNLDVWEDSSFLASIKRVRDKLVDYCCQRFYFANIAEVLAVFSKELAEWNTSEFFE